MLEEGLPLHPLKEQRESVNNWRQIGLGIMGLGDCLIKLGIKYGSEASLEICDKIGFAKSFFQRTGGKIFKFLEIPSVL